MQQEKSQPSITEADTHPASGREDFEQAAREQRVSLFREYLQFLSHNRKWWLLPVLAILLVVGALVLLSSTAAAPFIYTMF